jgi:hypothetical protein
MIRKSSGLLKNAAGLRELEDARKKLVGLKS